MQGLPGTYALILCSTRRAQISVGRLGMLSLRKGFYVYVGSAFGPGGLAARTRRHMLTVKKHHWHMDYLRPFVALDSIWYSYDPVHREHLWAKYFMNAPGSQVALRGFGASDCGCCAHLFFSDRAPGLKPFRDWIMGMHSNHAPIRRFCAGRKATNKSE